MYAIIYMTDVAIKKFQKIATSWKSYYVLHVSANELFFFEFCERVEREMVTRINYRGNYTFGNIWIVLYTYNTSTPIIFFKQIPGILKSIVR